MAGAASLGTGRDSFNDGGDIHRVSNEEPVPDDSSGMQFRTPKLGSP